MVHTQRCYFKSETVGRKTRKIFQILSTLESSKNFECYNDSHQGGRITNRTIQLLSGATVSKFCIHAKNKSNVRMPFIFLCEKVHRTTNTMHIIHLPAKVEQWFAPFKTYDYEAIASKYPTIYISEPIDTPKPSLCQKTPTIYCFRGPKCPKPTVPIRLFI